MPARSAGLTQRAGSDCGIACRFSGVSIVVGNTQLTLMPCVRNSADIASVSRITADFDAAYAPMFADARKAAYAATLTMNPCPAASIAGTTARAMSSTVLTFKSNRNRHASSLVSCTAATRKPPARLHSTSMRPNRASAASTTAFAPSLVARSAATKRRRASSSPKCCARPSRCRATRRRFAPRRANASATARPRLPLAPVMTTVSLVDSTRSPFLRDGGASAGASTRSSPPPPAAPRILLSSAVVAHVRFLSGAPTMNPQAAIYRRPHALGVHSLDRFVFSVPDLEAAERFYRCFGLDVRRDGDRLDLAARDSPHVWGSVYANGQPKKIQYLRFSAYADDFEALAARFRATGSEPPHPLSDGDGVWTR